MMRRGRQKLNQAGFSLVELIVVVLIIGILSGVGVVGIGYINGMNSYGAAGKMASLLERARIQTISADGNVSVTLVQEGKKYYGRIYQGGVETDKVEIGSTALIINAYKGTPSVPGTPEVVGGSTSCMFSYDKANGSFISDYTMLEFIGKETKIVQLIKTTGRSYLR